MINPRHKVNQTVYLYSASYTRDYDSHAGGKATIVKVNDEADWQRPLVPDYIMKIGRKQFLVPQIDIDESGSLKRLYEAKKRK